MSRVVVSKRIVMINAASSTLSVLTSLLLIVWLQQYLLRRITAEEYSLLPILMALMAFVPMLGSVLSGGIGRFMTVAYAKGDDAQITRISSTMLPILLGGAVLVLSVGGLVIWKIDTVLNIPPGRIDDARWMLGMLVTTAAIQLPVSAFNSGMVIRQKLVISDLIDFGSSLLQVAILFALLFGVSTRILWVVAATTIAQIVRLAVLHFFSVRLIPAQRFEWRSIDWPLARQLVNYGGWALVDQIARTAKDAMDPILLNRFATAPDLATFHVGGMPARQLQSLSNPLTRPFIPVFAALAAFDDLGKIRNVYLRGARYQTWVVSIVAVPAIIFAPDVMRLYLDGKYPLAGQVMAILLLIQLLQSLNALGPMAALAMGRVRELALRQIALQLFNLAATVVLVAWLQEGARGAAFASLAAMIFVNITFVFTFSRRITGTSFGEWANDVVARTLLPTLVPVSVCLFAKSQFAIDSWTALLLVSAASAISHILTILRFGPTADDRQDLRALVAMLPAAIGGPIAKLF